jgi:hypothetical protein
MPKYTFRPPTVTSMSNATAIPHYQNFVLVIPPPSLSFLHPLHAPRPYRPTLIPSLFSSHATPNSVPSHLVPSRYQNEFERHHAAHEALQTAHRALLRDREAADSEGAQWPARIQAVRVCVGVCAWCFVCA